MGRRNRAGTLSRRRPLVGSRAALRLRGYGPGPSPRGDCTNPTCAPTVPELPGTMPIAGSVTSSGGMAERTKAAVLKTAGPLGVPWVRIPLPPPRTRSLRIYPSAPTRRRDRRHARGSIPLHLPARGGWLRTGQPRASGRRGEGSNPTPSAQNAVVADIPLGAYSAPRPSPCARLDSPSPPGSWWLAADRTATRIWATRRRFESHSLRPERGRCGYTPRRLLGAETVAMREARFPFTSRLVVAGCGQDSHAHLGDAEKVRIPLPPPRTRSLRIHPSAPTRRRDHHQQRVAVSVDLMYDFDIYNHPGESGTARAPSCARPRPLEHDDRDTRRSTRSLATRPVLPVDGRRRGQAPIRPGRLG